MRCAWPAGIPSDLPGLSSSTPAPNSTRAAFSHDVGVAIGEPHQFDLLEPRLAEELRHPLGGAHHLGRVETGRRHARNSSQTNELGERPLEPALECNQDGARSGHASAHGSR